MLHNYMRKIRKRTPKIKKKLYVGVHLQLTDTVCCTITCGKLENVPQKTTKLLYWGTGHKKRAQTLISMLYQTN